MKNDITKLFEDVSIFEKKEFKLYRNCDENYYNISDEDVDPLLEYLGLLKEDKLITKCVLCEEKFPFTISIESYRSDNLNILLGYDAISKNYIYLDFEELNKIGKCKIKKSSVESKMFCINYRFVCTNKNKHIYFMKMLLYKYDDKIIVQKIGQYPSNTLLGDDTSEKYKTILRRFDKENGYLDYKSAEKSFKLGLYAGAYCYLRRLYERMINFYLDKEGIDTVNPSHKKDDINKIDKYFDKDIIQYLYPLYQALSVGIHNLSENECKTHYTNIKAVIDMQLQFIKSNDERDDQLKESMKSLNDLKNAKK